MDDPNPLKVLASIIRARRLRPPRPAGTATADHEALLPTLDAVSKGGVAAMADHRSGLTDYLAGLSSIDPDSLTPDHAMAFWLNLYNAGALDLARRAFETATETVLRVPGGFSETFIEVAGEELSLDGVEHGKIRRLQDPRIHGALVCGSVSCPTLRHEPYRGDEVDRQLDSQMKTFLVAGAAVADRDAGQIALSRVFRWFGADFARPHRMPALVPARRATVLDALEPWLESSIGDWARAARPKVTFQRYDWGLSCAVR